MICQRGHEFRGDENYRARSGYCPVCFREAQVRYGRSEKGRENKRRYLMSEHGRETRRQTNARHNARRVRAAGMYLGMCGFTVSETEAILDGSTD